MSLVQNIISSVLSIIVNILAKLIGGIIDVILSVIPFASIPDFTNYITALNNFWNYIFRCFGWVCNALMLTKFDLQLIFLALSIKLLYKPIVSLIKLFIKWYDTIKGLF